MSATWLDRRGLVLVAPDGGAPRRVDLVTAEIHYWRLHRSAWAPSLAAVRALGFEIAASPVPWSVHAPRSGALDWSGARDLGAFLDEAQRAGLLVLLATGPRVAADLPDLGIPRRVLDDPAVPARTAGGAIAFCPAPLQAVPLPSYESAAFQQAARAWLRALGEVVAPRLHPRGPVVALEMDGGPAALGRLAAFDLDHHPDAIASWRTATGAGPDEEPPRSWDPSDPARAAGWVRHQEAAGARAAAWIAAALEEAGLGAVARTVSGGPWRPALQPLPPLARAAGGPAWLDLPMRAREQLEVRRRALLAGGSVEPLPLVRLEVGGAPWLPPVAGEEQAAVALGALAGGARGLAFRMVVDRDRWHGAPVDQRGATRPAADWLRALLAGLRSIDWTCLEHRAPVALVLSRAEARHGIASTIAGPLPPITSELLARAGLPRSLGLGPDGDLALARDPAASRHRRWEDAVAAALDRAGLCWTIVDEEAAEERLLACGMLVLPTHERVDRALWRRLREAAARGVRVIIGPGRPALDELERPLGEDAALPRPVGLMRAGSLDDLDGLARDLAAAAGPAARAPLNTRAPVTLSFFHAPGGALRAVLLGNPAPDSIAAALSVATAPASAGDSDATAATIGATGDATRDATGDGHLAGLALRDLLTGERFAARGGAIEVGLDAYAVRLMTVERT